MLVVVFALLAAAGYSFWRFKQTDSPAARVYGFIFAIAAVAISVYLFFDK